MYTKHRQKNIPITSTECGRSILFAFLILLNTILETVSGEAGEQGELRGQIVVPYWVSTGRSKREAGIPPQVRFPDRGEIALTAEGKELLLQLERNHQLLGQDFTETHYAADGTPVTITPNYTDHCYYHGHVSGYTDSWVALSTCSGIRYAGYVTLKGRGWFGLDWGR
ncbi:hypothetical protein MATL_G00192760 [Megalops atlanticus]|uniref:Peptidase M12B propeptide domain-containing protein n=1 Tax=Megalops atlanticus TaxID=7932 RepID=A0A9D3SZ13_MEGAT|nr:hypothetical protein MATL_G00192760 [Megalops atlanticus]